MNYIDWENQEKCIRNSFTMTDREVDEVLNALNQAKKIYEKIADISSLPERISLADKSGYVRHSIITRNGVPTTVIIKPVFLLTSLIKPCIVFGLVAVGLFAAYNYFY
jgi:hypothetical protein